MSSVSSKSTNFSESSSEFRWMLCKGCKTTVPEGVSTAECWICLALAERRVVRCLCGNKCVFCYRPTKLLQSNCLRCIASGSFSARTEAQQEAVSQFALCRGVCGLQQRNGNYYRCKDCFAVAAEYPELHKKLIGLKKAWRQAALDNAYVVRMPEPVAELAAPVARPVASVDRPASSVARPASPVVDATSLVDFPVLRK